MKFPKEAADKAANYQEAIQQGGSEIFLSEYVDPKDLDDLVQFAEFANAKLQEQFTALTKLQLTIHRAQHALKEHG